MPLSEAVGAILVTAEDCTGYDDEQSFGGWIDADRDGCSTRGRLARRGRRTTDRDRPVHP
ncbi:hypothetical protein [Streptomyces hokutonensis]|uniref:hypothetical protein n=1 Tax=Streptomyces hokutonensis TaxID=1306990 RepID=UPI000399DF83|nr:hypothetical protein [Streptomyces hokutonensis]